MEKIILTEETIRRRSIIKNRLDSFMDFQWDGLSAFENFGAFIINDKKGSLKFYNGPSFSNEYSKPQFDNNGGNLVGVTFNKQTISFSIGVYWISEADYRKLINWLSPLITSYIIFDFEPKYRYNVKLSKMGDSTRWFVGYENITKEKYNSNNEVETYIVSEPRYYTELTLTFELQGAQCAKGVHSYEANWEWDEDKQQKIGTIKNVDFTPSDLPCPIELKFGFDLKASRNINEIKHQISLKAIYDNQEKELFSIVLSNLTHLISDAPTTLALNMSYNSETGLLFLVYGSNKILLSLLNTTDTGEKIVDSSIVNKFFIPGLFDFPDFDYSKFYFQFDTKTIEDNIINSEDFLNNIELTCYPRTNII